MSKKVLILHGWGGSDYPHWQSWSASQLIKENYIVSFPQLPNKDFPNLNEPSPVPSFMCLFLYICSINEFIVGGAAK